MFIRSERLFLRPAWPEEEHELLTKVSDPDVAGNLMEDPRDYTSGNFLLRQHEWCLPQFVITLPMGKGGRLAGRIGLSREGDAVELAFWIDRPLWGRGFATEAVRALLPLAQTLGHRRIVASHFDENPAAGRVLAKAGFRPLGGKGTRFSSGRGIEAPTIRYAMMLGVPGDGRDGVPHRLAA